MQAAKILVIAAHPAMEYSRLTRRLMRAAASAATDDVAAGNSVEVRDLYALYPDYLVDVAVEQAALSRADLIVWLHPIHWYSMPPLMKLWLDDVLAFGWAYGPGGEALRGKNLWLVTSTGGDDDSYRPDGHNRYFFDAFLPPYEQTAALCGMRFLPPLVLHGAHRITQDEIDRHAELLAQRLGDYPAWPELAQLDDCIDCQIPGDARPAERGERLRGAPLLASKPERVG